MKKPKTRGFLIILAVLVIYLLISLLAGAAVSFYMNPTLPTAFCNTKWVCQEADIYFITDKHGHCCGEALADGESVFFYLSVWGTADSLTGEVRRIEGASLDGILNNSSGELLFTADVKCTKRRCVMEIPPDFLPLWGITAPATLHFIREELEEPVDFYGPDCPICYPDNHQLDDYPNTRWVCQEADMYFLEDCRGTCYGEAVVDGVSVFFSLARKESAGVEAYQCYTDTLEGIAGAPRSQEPVFQGAFACTQEGGEFGGMADYFHLWEAPGTLPMKVREITLTFLREELPEPVDFSKVSP